MNLKIEIELAFQDASDILEELLVDIADILKEYGYGNDSGEEDAYVKSFIRVKKLDDDEVILVVIPIKDEDEEEGVINDA